MPFGSGLEEFLAVDEAVLVAIELAQDVVSPLDLAVTTVVTVAHIDGDVNEVRGTARRLQVA